MEELISDIYEIIKDFREEEGMMNKERIKIWIDQFNPDDRIFVLEEMKHILKQRYISKDKAKELVKGMIEFLVSNFKFNSAKDFLLQSSFIDNQPEGKSQKVLLKFLDEIIQTEYSTSIAECNSTNPKYYIYIDDILCTGDTLIKGLTINKGDNIGWFNKTNENGKTNLTIFNENKAVLVIAYFCVHKLKIKKLHQRLWFIMDKKNIEMVYAFDDTFNIDNDIDDPNSKLDFLFPTENVKDDSVIEFQTNIENKIWQQGYNKTDKIKYREQTKPHNETFFTSAPNRERFEKIILTKGIELYNHSETLKNNFRARPLGYGLAFDMNLGFGTLIFTWRNVPFNVPLVFWYQDHLWKPLFERKFISFTSKDIETTLKVIAEEKMKNITQEEYNVIRTAYVTNREKHKTDYPKLLELDVNFLEEITGIEKKYWIDGYLNSPSFHRYFKKITMDARGAKFLNDGYESWAKGLISSDNLLFKFIILNNRGAVFNNIESLRKKILESSGVGEGSPINTIKLGMPPEEQEKK